MIDAPPTVTARGLTSVPSDPHSLAERGLTICQPNPRTVPNVKPKRP